MLLVKRVLLCTDTSNTKRPVGFRGYLTPTACVIQHGRGKWGLGARLGKDKLCFGSPLAEAAKTYHRLVNEVNKDGPFGYSSKSNSRALG